MSCRWFGVRWPLLIAVTIYSAFCKDEDTLKAAGERLLALKPFIRKE